MAASLQLLRRPVGAGASFSLSATSPARPRDQNMEKLVLPWYFYLSILYFVLCICNCILTCILAENICFLFWYCEWLWLCCFLPQGMLYLCCNTKQQRLSLGLLKYNRRNLCRSSCSRSGPTTFSDHNGPQWQHNINIGIMATAARLKKLTQHILWHWPHGNMYCGQLALLGTWIPLVTTWRPLRTT